MFEALEANKGSFVCSAGDCPAKERTRDPVARLAVGMETELLESNDKAI
jgi:hypothetical protein